MTKNEKKVILTAMKKWLREYNCFYPGNLDYSYGAIEAASDAVNHLKTVLKGVETS